MREIPELPFEWKSKIQTSNVLFAKEAWAARAPIKLATVWTPDPHSEVRLQLEALLAEKSRLANENANLTRENQCLHQLVEYHQLTSQDLSDSYDDVIRGLCLDFSSPPSAAAAIPEEEEEEKEENAAIPEEEEEEKEENGRDGDGNRVPTIPQTGIFGLCTSLDEFYEEEEEQKSA
ncbi:hypothetical protein U1Q18_034128 [Sarracenia purpurea var. burkii]